MGGRRRGGVALRAVVVVGGGAVAPGIPHGCHQPLSTAFHAALVEAVVARAVAGHGADGDRGRDLDFDRLGFLQLSELAQQTRVACVSSGSETERRNLRLRQAPARAGAGTIAEVAAAGMPAIFVPLPNAPSDHQMRNAQTLERIGAAVVLRDEECDPRRLDAIVSELMRAPDRLERMSKAAKTVSRLDAAARVADLAEEHARG